MSSTHTWFNRHLILLSISHATTDLSQGALPILLPFLKTAFHLSYAQIGVIVLAQNFTSSIIQPIFGYLTDRVPMPWLIPTGLLLSGLGMAATGMASSYNSLLAIVIVTGLGIAAFHPQGSKSAYSGSSPALRGRSMALFSVGGNLGGACGSIFMTLLLTMPGDIGNTLYFCIPAVLLTLMLSINMKQLSPATPRPLPKTSPSSPQNTLPYFLICVLLLVIFLRSSIQAGLSTYIPLYYIEHLKGSPLYASYLISAFMLSGVLGTFVGGTLSDRIGRKTIIMGSMVLTFPMLCLLPYTTGIGTLLLMICIGLTFIASFSTTTVLAQEMMPGYEASAASLTIGFSIGLGGVAATLLGYMADHFGIPTVFSVISIFPLLILALATLLPGRLFQKDHSV